AIAYATQAVPIWIELSRNSELGHRSVVSDRMNKHAAIFAPIEDIVVDQLGDERDGAHLTHQRTVEADFVHAIEDFRRRLGQLLALDRIDVDQDHVFGTAVVDQGKDGGIAHGPAVPIVLTIDLDGVE